MPVSGYDPDDLEELLAERLDSHDPGTFLTDDQRRRLDEGESLLDVLDSDEIERLVDGTSGEEDE